MKFKLNFRLTLICSLFLMISVLVFSPNSAEAKKPDVSKSFINPICGGDPTTGGVVTAPGTTNCEFQPDEQKITFYRLDLCTSDPTPPTKTSQVDRSNCSTFYRNDNGSAVTVIENQGSQVGNTEDYNSVPYGTYTYGIITMGSVFKYKTSLTFDAAMTDNGGNAGTTCVTKVSNLGVIYGFSTGLLTGTAAQRFAKGNVDCQAGATAEEIEIGINTMTMTEDGNNNCFHRLNIDTSFGIVNAYLLESDYTIQSDVTDNDVAPNASAGCTAQTDNGIKYIMGIMPFSTPITISPRTAGLQVQYGNKRGMMIDLSGNNQFWKYDGGFFNFNLRSVTRRPRGAWN
jgi:hypothetical protein